MTRLWRLALPALVALAVVPATAAAAEAPVGAVYTETNETFANKVVVYDRFADGHLRRRDTVATGGKGGAQAQPGCPGACPFLDTQGEVIVTPDGNLVFAVNAGSNTISAFRETPGGLVLVDQEPSGGEFPNSLTSHDNMLYVLNSNSDAIAGFRFTSKGNMTPIAGSSEPLSTPTPVGFNARQIGFDRTGKVLTVTVLGASVIDSFVLDAAGTPGPATPHPSTTPLPFGFAFAPNNTLVVSQLTDPSGIGDTASYGVSGAGAVTPIDTQSAQGAAPCWVVVTRDGIYVFVVNTGAGAPATIARYRLRTNGTLKFLGLTPPNGSEFARTDAALSRDSKYLYVLVPSIFGGSTSHIDEYGVGADGSLTLIGTTASTLAPGVSGLAAR